MGTDVVSVPFIFEEASKLPGLVKKMGFWRTVAVGGAPLSKNAGDVLNKHINVINLLGSTEIGFILNYVPEDKEDWQYFQPHPAMAVEFRPSGDDGFAEMVITRKDKTFSQLYFKYSQTLPSSLWEIFGSNILQSQICGNMSADLVMSSCFPAERNLSPSKWRGLFQLIRKS
jgi:hypothetical protein